ncbi:MAG: terminase [Acidobacteriaceae bacterium]
MNGDLVELLALGRMLDEPAEALGGETAGIFLAEVLLKVRTRMGAFAPLRPNRAQREFQRRRGRANIVLKARQMGISTWVAGRFFLKTVTQPGTLSMQVAHTQEAAEEIFRVVRRFHSELPEGLREGALRTSRANARSLVFPELDSEYRVETAGDPNAGRGLTVQNLHCSEVARWPGDTRATLAGLLATMPAGGGEVVLESTAQGAHGCFYEEWMHAEANGWVRHFFPWWWEASYRLDVSADAESEEERTLVSKYGLTREQIAFRRRLQRQFGVLARQEYPESADDCFLASGSCVFDTEAIDRRLRDVPAPAERRWAGALELWLKPMPGREYLVSVDPAGGGSEGDYAAIQVLDAATGLQCAEFQGRCGLLELAQRAATLGREYNGAMLIVERNNHGAGVLAYLTGTVQYARLYQQDGQAGWLTTALSRPRVLEHVERLLGERAEGVMSARLLREMKTFVRDARGRTGAAQGQHDDLVMAMGIGLAVRELTVRAIAPAPAARDVGLAPFGR